MDNKELLKQMIADGVLIPEVAAKYCPELIESEEENIRKSLIGHLKECRNNTRSEVMLGEYAKWIAWLEKQGEQKPTGKVEPKFHEGEWVTNGDYTWKIIEVKPLDYILQSQDGNIVDDTTSHVDEQFHSFTIEDAKDGDVLAFKDGTSGILIYKECTENFGVLSYCRIVRNSFIDKEESGWSLTSLSPATNEQRDILFAKIKEAGYEWDVKKRDFNKIEEKSAEWSEEDKRHIELLISMCEEEQEIYQTNSLPYINIGEAINWLKSLRPQKTWKPSDEQMKALDIAIRCGIQLGTWEEDALKSLKEQLKKLID